MPQKSPKNPPLKRKPIPLVSKLMLSLSLLSATLLKANIGANRMPNLNLLSWAKADEEAKSKRITNKVLFFITVGCKLADYVEEVDGGKGFPYSKHNYRALFRWIDCWLRKKSVSEG